MSKIGKLSFFFIVTIITTTITFTSCSKDDDDETISGSGNNVTDSGGKDSDSGDNDSDSGDKVYYQGVNIIGIWAITTSDYKRYYEDDYIYTTKLYVVKADGTIDYYYHDECDCDRTITNGIINCSLDHYTFKIQFKYSIEGDYIYFLDRGYQLKITNKASDDEITVESGWTYFNDATFYRVKFAQ